MSRRRRGGQAAQPLLKITADDLPSLEKASVIFGRDPGFSLGEFVTPPFGVYKENPVDVVWRFSAETVPIARQFQFHPGQTVKIRHDGATLVCFHGGGLLEMALHLMT